MSESCGRSPSFGRKGLRGEAREPANLPLMGARRRLRLEAGQCRQALPTRSWRREAPTLPRMCLCGGVARLGRWTRGQGRSWISAYRRHRDLELDELRVHVIEDRLQKSTKGALLGLVVSTTGSASATGTPMFADEDRSPPRHAKGCRESQPPTPRVEAPASGLTTPERSRNKAF